MAVPKIRCLASPGGYLDGYCKIKSKLHGFYCYIANIYYLCITKQNTRNMEENTTKQEAPDKESEERKNANKHQFIDEIT